MGPRPLVLARDHDDLVGGQRARLVGLRIAQANAGQAEAGADQNE